MRGIFYLLLALLVLKLFMPDLGHEIEKALLAFLDFASRTLANPPV